MNDELGLWLERTNPEMYALLNEERQFHAEVMLKDQDRITELEDALVAIASAPYPLHDHCTPEQWELACNLYQKSINREQDK